MNNEMIMTQLLRFKSRFGWNLLDDYDMTHLSELNEDEFQEIYDQAVEEENNMKYGRRE